MGVSRSLSASAALTDLSAVVVTLLLSVFALTWATGTLATAPFATAVSLALCSTILKRRGERWLELGLGRPRPWPLVLVTSFLLTFLILFAIATLQPVLEARFGIVELSELGAIEGDTTLFLYFLFVAWLLAGLGEETLFRGFVMRRIAQGLGEGPFGWTAALLGQSVLFGLFHFYLGPTGMIMTGLMGLAFGLAFLGLERNLWACIFAHALVDTVFLTDLYLGGDLL